MPNDFTRPPTYDLTSNSSMETNSVSSGSVRIGDRRSRAECGTVLTVVDKEITDQMVEMILADNCEFCEELMLNGLDDLLTLDRQVR